MEQEQITAKVANRITVLKQESEQRERQITALIELEGEVAKLREELGLAEATTTRYLRVHMGADESAPWYQVAIENIKRHKKNMFEFAASLGSVSIQKKRWVDLDMAGGYSPYETLVLGTNENYYYLVQSTKSDRNTASRIDRSHEETKIYLFSETMEYPLCVTKSAFYCNETITFEIGRSALGVWQEVINYTDVVKSDLELVNTNRKDRWDERIVHHQLGPAISLL